MIPRKEKDKAIQDKLQIILADLLKDEDNKYCVDCDTKGPRWASWTLGIFLCIRCAGIHRNLGVHISRVKSVNLDSWSPQEVAMMKEIGNSRGRAIYEANLDDGFRRPQTDQSLEQFIRAKYEHKRHIAKEWIPPNPTADSIAEDIRKLERNMIKKKSNNASSIKIPTQNPPAIERPRETKQPDNTGDSKKAAQNNKIDLLDLNNDACKQTDTSGQNDDAFGDFVFATQPVPTTTANNGASVQKGEVNSAVNDLLGLNLGGGLSMPSSNNGGFEAQFGNGVVNSTANATCSTTGAMDKNSILALYAQSNSTSMSASNNGWPMNNGTQGHQQSQQTQQASWPTTNHPGAYQQSYSQNFIGQNPNQPSTQFGLQNNPFFNNNPQQNSNTAFSQFNFIQSTPATMGGGINSGMVSHHNMMTSSAFQGSTISTSNIPTSTTASLTTNQNLRQPQQPTTNQMFW